MDDIPRTEADVSRIADMVTARRVLARCLARLAAMEGENAELQRSLKILREESASSERRVEGAMADRIRMLERDVEFRTQAARKREDELRALERDLVQREARVREAEAAVKSRQAGLESRARELEAEHALKRERLEDIKERMRDEITATARGYKTGRLPPVPRVLAPRVPADDPPPPRGGPPGPISGEVR